MKKIIITAAILLSTIGTFNTASAFSFNFDQSFWDAVASYYANKNKITSPGDAFDPHASDRLSTAELSSICVDMGGTPGRKFQGNDFQFYCAQ